MIQLKLQRREQAPALQQLSKERVGRGLAPAESIMAVCTKLLKLRKLHIAEEVCYIAGVA